MNFDPDEIQKYLDLMEGGSSSLSKVLDNFVKSSKSYLFTLVLVSIAVSGYFLFRQINLNQDEIFRYWLDTWQSEKVESWELVKPSLYNKKKRKAVLAELKNLARRTGVDAVYLYVYQEPGYKLLVEYYAENDVDPPRLDQWVLPTLDEGYARELMYSKVNTCLEEEPNFSGSLLNRSLARNEFKHMVFCPLPIEKQWTLTLLSKTSIIPDRTNFVYQETKVTAQKLEEILKPED